MASSSARGAAPVMVQTNTYNMNTNPQETPCTQRCYPCSVCLIVFACLNIFGGIVFTILGTVLGETSNSLYDSSPSLRKADQTKLYIGITLLIVGVILLILCIVWCHRIKRNFSPPVMYSGTAMTTVVQPPIIQGTGGHPSYVNPYLPVHQAGSIQHGQPATNQFTSVQPTSYQFHSVHPTAQPSAPSAEPPNQPPPSYNELMHSDGNTALSHGAVMTVV